MLHHNRLREATGVGGAALAGKKVVARRNDEDVCLFSSRRRHTRCSRDWSSDVCSSDLSAAAAPGPFVTLLFSRTEISAADNCVEDDADVARLDTIVAPFLHSYAMAGTGTLVTRSEERRGGEEGRTPWWPDHLKKKK